MSTLRRALAGLSCIVHSACAGSSAQSGSPGTASTSVPALAAASPGALARFATQKLIVYPVQALPSVAPTEWRPAIGDANLFLLKADSAIELALGGRGLATLWVFPKALQRAARRNPTYLIDPYTTRVAAALYVAMRKKDEPIPEPAAGVMRAHASVSDARYLLVPLEVRVDSIEARGRIVARLAVVDARGSQVVWVGETMTALHSTFSAEMIEELASRVADLVVPR